MIVRIFIAVLILIFNLQFLTKADDISEFEIEGMSIGDSALKFFSKTELSNALDIHDYKNNKYRYYFLKFHKSKNYDYVQITVKPNDKEFLMYEIQGSILYKKNIKECYKKLNQVNDEISNIFNVEGKKTSDAHWIDKSGKSKFERISFYVENGAVKIICYDMSKKFEKEGKYDRFSISVISNEYQQWINKTY